MGVRELKGEAWDLLASAAVDEAARAGHGEVDVDHVLLALLVAGGPSTELLSRAGLDLSTARRALARLQRQDLDSQGPAVPVIAVPVPRPSSEHTSEAGTAAMPWSDRARRAVAVLPGDAPDTAVLDAVLSHEDGPARRLLEQADIDAGAVLSAARVMTADRPAATVPDDARAWTAGHTRTVAVGREDLWRLVSDPRRRREWDDSVAQVRVLDDATFETLDAVAVQLPRPGGQGDDPGLLATHRVVEAVEGRLIEWETRYPNRGHTEWLRLEMEDDGTVSRLTLRHAAGRPRGILRLLSRPYAWTTRLRLRLLAQAIAQAASDG